MTIQCNECERTHTEGYAQGGHCPHCGSYDIEKK